MPRKSPVSVGTAKRSSSGGSKSNGRVDSSEGSTPHENGGAAPQQHEPIQLADGTEMPVGIPPGMDPNMAKELIEYLRQNPEVARQTYNEAQRLLQNPRMAAELAQSQQVANMQSPEQQAKLMQLKDDPELKDMFEDIQQHGAGAMERYWNDTEMMSKISQKMQELDVTPSSPSQPDESRPKQKGSKYRSDTLHDAAKAGDVSALQQLIDSGENVNCKDARGITPLGVAVGFNRLAAVKALLSAKADVSITDGRGNTPLHYAAGYGRKEAAQLLLDAGAEPSMKNTDGQTPADAARLNREMHMVAFMEERGGEYNSKYL